MPALLFLGIGAVAVYLFTRHTAPTSILPGPAIQSDDVTPIQETVGPILSPAHPPMGVPINVPMRVGGEVAEKITPLPSTPANLSHVGTLGNFGGPVASLGIHNPTVKAYVH